MALTTHPSPRTARLDLILLVAVLLVAALFAAQALAQPSHPAEDAAMLMRYSAHLAQGHGIVWNIGEKPVDGATDFLFMVLLAGLNAAGLSLESAVLGLGTAAHLLTVALVFWTVARIEPRNIWLAVFSALLVAVGPGMAYTTAYFGTTTFALAGALTWHLACRLALCEHPARKLTLGFAFASLLTGLIRPEGVFLALLILLGLLVRREGRDSRAILRDTALVFGGLGLVYFFGRWAYFGYPLPNPFYKKGGGLLYPEALLSSMSNLFTLNQPYIWLLGGTLIALLVKWLPSLRKRQLSPAESQAKLRLGLYLASALCGAVVLIGFSRRSEPNPGNILGVYSQPYFILLTAGVILAVFLFLLAFSLSARLRLPWFSSQLSGAMRDGSLAGAFLLIPVIGFSLIWILISNEMNYLGRFQYILTPLILMTGPVLLSGLGTRVEGWSARWKQAARLALALCAVGGIAVTFLQSGTSHYLDGRYDAAIYLRQYAGKGYTLATSEAGLLPFYSSWRTVDTWGLNDQEIAQSGKLTEEYLDSNHPELIIFHANLIYTEADPQTAWDWMARTLWNYARGRGYILAAAFGSEQDDYHYYYVRQDFEDAPAIIAQLRSMDYTWFKNGQRAVNHAPTSP